jgi:hypothetical protein
MCYEGAGESLAGDLTGLDNGDVYWDIIFLLGVVMVLHYPPANLQVKF